MKYHLHVKSHTDVPDYHDNIEADSKEEAIQKFCECLDFPEDVIRASVEEPMTSMYERITSGDKPRWFDLNKLATVLEDLEKKIEVLEGKRLPKKMIGVGLDWNVTKTAMSDDGSDEWLVHNLHNYIAHNHNQAIDECIEVVRRIKDRGIGNTSQLYMEELIQLLEALKK